MNSILVMLKEIARESMRYTNCCTMSGYSGHLVRSMIMKSGIFQAFVYRKMGKKSSWSIILNHLQHMAAHYHVLLALG